MNLAIIAMLVLRIITKQKKTKGNDMELISKRDDRSIFWQMILGLLFVAAAATGSYVLSHTLTHPAQYAQYTQAQN